jgi:hypothetical protein
MLNELQDEQIDVDFDSEEPLVDELDVRAAMIVIRQLEVEAEKTLATGRKVVERYVAKAASLSERAQFLREKVRLYVQAYGKTSFPDVGTAYETKTKPKLVVTDQEAVAAKYGETFVKETFDEADFKRWALERFEQTGEIPDGCDVVRESTTLAIRKS